jgi:hypothetical protein
MTLWQDPVPAMSFSYQAAEQYCSSSRVAGFADWKVPSGVALNKLCVLNATSPVLADITAPYWIAAERSGSTGWERVVSCDANGIEMARSELQVARVRCVHAPSD